MANHSVVIREWSDDPGSDEIFIIPIHRVEPRIMNLLEDCNAGKPSPEELVDWLHDDERHAYVLYEGRLVSTLIVAKVVHVNARVSKRIY